MTTTTITETILDMADEKEEAMVKKAKLLEEAYQYDRIRAKIPERIAQKISLTLEAIQNLEKAKAEIDVMIAVLQMDYCNADDTFINIYDKEWDARLGVTASTTKTPDKRFQDMSSAITEARRLLVKTSVIHFFQKDKQAIMKTLKRYLNSHGSREKCDENGMRLYSPAGITEWGLKKSDEWKAWIAKYSEGYDNHPTEAYEHEYLAMSKSHSS